MTIREVTQQLEHLAPLYLQEEYDNAGLITGDEKWICCGIICSLDITDAVINEALEKKCNLIVVHHPMVFRPLKKFTNNEFTARLLVIAIKNDIAIYAIHTNLDNIIHGVNGVMARRLGLMEKSFAILQPKLGTLAKLCTYVPEAQAVPVRDALFKAGAGAIGGYHECSFSITGLGTFKPMEGTNPFIGSAGGKREEITEVKMEFIFPVYMQARVMQALLTAHPYEEVAYEIIRLENKDQYTGAGLLGELPVPIDEYAFLQMVKQCFNLTCIRHTPLLNRLVKRVAVCGGSGSFLTKKAIAAGADVFITADVKYHEFFDADSNVLLVDIGHWESEQFTVDLLANFLQDKFPTFAVLKTEVNTNPVHHFV